MLQLPILTIIGRSSIVSILVILIRGLHLMAVSETIFNFPDNYYSEYAQKC